MGRYIFTFIFGFTLLTVYDRFFSRRKPRGWFVRWREDVVISFLAVFVSLFLNNLLNK